MSGDRMRDSVMTEADTCREFVTPRLVKAGWSVPPDLIGEQRTFTNGRIIVAGGKVRRGNQKRADYLLYHHRDFPLAVVEAKESGLPAETGVQQAREYAEILALNFAYAKTVTVLSKSTTPVALSAKKSVTPNPKNYLLASLS